MKRILTTRAGIAVALGLTWVIGHAQQLDRPAPTAPTHGASRGLHLHLSPDPAARGSEIQVEIDAEAAVREVQAGFVGHDPETRRPERPARRLELRLRLPVDVGGATVNCQVEARTVRGDLLRASAVLRVADPLPLQHP